MTTITLCRYILDNENKLLLFGNSCVTRLNTKTDGFLMKLMWRERWKHRGKWPEQQESDQNGRKVTRMVGKQSDNYSMSVHVILGPVRRTLTLWTSFYDLDFSWRKIKTPFSDDEKQMFLFCNYKVYLKQRNLCLTCLR